MDRCPSLHTLHLTGTSVTDKGLEYLGKNCNILKELDLTGVETISDDGVCKIADGCPNLVYVSLQDCSTITSIGAYTLVVQCPLLEQLLILQHGCSPSPTTGG